MTLEPEDREYLSLIKEAGLSNPFSELRNELDARIIGGGAGLSQPQIVERMITAVREKIEDLKRKGIRTVNSVADPDRLLVETVFLFDFFYKYRKNFDDLILEQMEADEKPVRLSFALQAKADLEQLGFDAEAIGATFEEAYQLRRAFFIINRYIIGKSPIMRKLRVDVWNNIFTHNINIYRKYLRNQMEDFSTLILGKTGAGKGAVAAAIGQSGYIPFDLRKLRFTTSFTTSFIAINLSQFPETLIESELFGHRKGAFTGAMENYEGVFKRCTTHGAIFLDEIGDISMPIQVKLLQVLQERIFYPVGSTRKERFQGRVIAATNMPIDALRGKGVFRDDFYYRLCSDVITVPTLFERLKADPSELKDLLSFIVKRMIGKDSPELVDMVKDVIDTRLGRDYPWPGNVRELEQCVRRVLLKLDYEGDTVTVGQDLESQLRDGFEKGTISAPRLIQGYCKLLYQRYGTFEEVSRRTQLDRRTVHKYIREWEGQEDKD
jgi:DNA-binding NtrC family response regulator